MLTACSALTFAACGGDGQRAAQRTATGPTIERAVADRLASRSDKVASLLDRNDACGASAEARGLRADLTAAINKRAIPELYLEDLSGLVNEIQAQIPRCPELQPPPDTDGEGKGKKKGKKKNRHGGDEGDD